MPHRGASGLILLFAVLTAAPANVVVLGAASSLGGYTVRLIGQRLLQRRRHRTPDRGHRRALRPWYARRRRRWLAARHRRLAQRAARRRAARVYIRRRRLRCTLPNRCLTAAPRRSAPAAATASPLPATAPPTSARGAFGSLHEAILVAAGARALVDPARLLPKRRTATALRRAPPRGPLLACLDGVAATKRKVPTNPAWTSLVWRGKIWHGLLGQ